MKAEVFMVFGTRKQGETNKIVLFFQDDIWHENGTHFELMKQLTRPLLLQQKHFRGFISEILSNEHQN